jgi:hypothetical protein
LKFIFTLIVVSSLAACAVSGTVAQMGPDTYSTSAVASPARGGSGEARNMVLAQANKHCSGMGKEIMVVDVSTKTLNAMGAGSADVTYRCLTKGDPDLQRPTYRQAPTTVIEDRRK